jgi:hypothetical protein
MDLSSSEIDYTPGKLVVIWITGNTANYIAEVVTTDPLVLKVEEDGPYARLKDGDFILRQSDTLVLQRDMVNGTEEFIKNCKRPPLSGLKVLGAPNGKLCESGPSTNP